MKRLGLIVRADGGGLGNQTRSMLAHLSPDRVLVVSMGAMTRGGEQVVGAHPVVRYQHAETRAMDDFLAGIDVMLSVETFYEPYLVIRAEDLAIERVLYANPELLNVEDPAERADRYLWPARWEYAPPARGEILAWPAPTDTIDAHEVGRGNRPLELVHVSAPAMRDRDGKDVLLDALGLMTERARLTIFGQDTVADWHNDRVSVTWAPPVTHHSELYAGADVLVLPRRYGCLSLPMLEAAAAGVPTLTTALLPQREWFAEWPELLIPPGRATRVPMKGNWHGVPVHEPDPAQLAQALDHLTRTDGLVTALGRAVRAWAERRSWEKLLPEWWAKLL